MIKNFIYTEPSKLPISFKYDGQVINGIPESFCPIVSSEVVNGVKKIVYSGSNTDGLEIRVICTTYTDFPVAEYVAYIINNSDVDSKIVREFRIFNSIIEGTNPIITFATGDTCDQRGYETHTEQLGEKLILEPVHGNPCNGASPFIKLRFDEYELRLAIGWLGKWNAFFLPTKTDKYGVIARIGQARCNMKLHPGESIRTPSLTIMCNNLNEQDSTNLWRRWFRKYIMPTVDGKPYPALKISSARVPEFEEFCGITTTQQIDALEKMADSGDTSDIWWIDAGWYKCDGEWHYTGNWYPDPERFPEGLGTIGKKCEEIGTKFLLWFEPERVCKGTEIYTSHPEWVLKSDGADMRDYNLLNYSIPECVDWVIDLVDGIIKDGKVKIYREDFNINPEPYWIKHETQDRIGAIENGHVQGHIRFWDTLAERNPGLLFDVCASGGRRNEMESLRRGVPYHYTDVGYGSHTIKQKQTRFLNEWTPYYRSHACDWRDENDKYIPGLNRTPDAFTLLCSFAPAIEINIPKDIDHKITVAEYCAIWKKTASVMLDADYYPLTECRKSTKDFYAEQFEIPEKGIGFFRIISNVDNENEETVLDMHYDGLRKYELCESFGDAELEITSDGKLKIKCKNTNGIIQLYKF